MQLLKFNSVQSIDWAAVKEQWDTIPLVFYMSFKHDGNEIQFQSGLDHRKTVKIMVYVNGQFEGKWLTDNVAHSYQKYMNVKTFRLTAKEKQMNKLMLRWNGKKKGGQLQRKPLSYQTPIFDNVTQIKRMVKQLNDLTTSNAPLT